MSTMLDGFYVPNGARLARDGNYYIPYRREDLIAALVTAGCKELPPMARFSLPFPYYKRGAFINVDEKRVWVGGAAAKDARRLLDAIAERGAQW